MNKKEINKYLQDVLGVIHVGANFGQEARRYYKHNLNVIWIEPIPFVYEMLVKNVSEYPKQRSHMALITDVDDEEYELHVANNTGASSSIFEFGDDFHKEHPTIQYTETIRMKGMTLPTLLERTRSELHGHDALVIDTQGSELLVLRGAEKILRWFKYVRVEAADFQLYKDSCVYDEVDTFMQKHGFQELYRYTSESKREHDIVYKRI